MRRLLPRHRKISIHALRGEGDVRQRVAAFYSQRFQSTPSVGRATIYLYNAAFDHLNFNPRPPWGGRLLQDSSARGTRVFQSTPSVGRATTEHLASDCSTNISIHALRGEGDYSIENSLILLDISIHALRGEGDVEQLGISGAVTDISIHALRGEGDCKNIQICNAMLVHSAYKTVYFCDSCAFYLT